MPDDEIGTPETREMAEAVARGQDNVAEPVIKNIAQQLEQVSDKDLVDLKRSFEEWKKKTSQFWPHLHSWEASLKVFSPVSMLLHGGIEGVFTMLVQYVIAARDQKRKNRFSEVLSSIDEEINKRLQKNRSEKDA